LMRHRHPFSRECPGRLAGTVISILWRESMAFLGSCFNPHCTAHPHGEPAPTPVLRSPDAARNATSSRDLRPAGVT
jgi:hypothetical protein